jgi:hypothetical protein
MELTGFAIDVVRGKREENAWGVEDAWVMMQRVPRRSLPSFNIATFEQEKIKFARHKHAHESASLLPD